ncbi:hypothetical protein FACS1894158_15700 [Betaproteobacteria bacterium]|nr:hypothetical protein FACS1894158_15700 [Betaproteobacteria bacterium]
MKPTLAIILYLLSAGILFAEENANYEGFDYIRGKIDGRATISSRWAKLHLTGYTAEAMYYQISAPVIDGVYSSANTLGQSRGFPGLHCIKYQLQDARRDGYECFGLINLKTGMLDDANFHEMETGDDEDEAAITAWWDAQGNRRPRVSDPEWANLVIGDAEIKIKDGIPCFSVSQKNDELGMSFKSLAVSNTQDGEIIWGYLWNSLPIPLPKDVCFHYGILPEGAIIGHQVIYGIKSLPLVAPLLLLNTVYTISIGVDDKNNGDIMPGFFAQFCLQKNAHGALTVQKVQTSCDTIISSDDE